MNISFLLKRIQAMSVSELAYRLKTRMIFEYLRHYRELHKTTREMMLDYSISFQYDFHEGQKTDIIQKANDLIQGNRNFFGRSFQYESEKGWLYDPTSGGTWPLVYFLDIDYRASDAPGDPKMIWEMARQQYLVLIALAYRWTGEQKYRAYIIQDILSWIEQNPPLMGIHWVSAMESGIRILSWVFTLTIMGKNTLTAIQQTQIMQSICEQASFISLNLSKYSSANNHLIGELTGLLAAALFVESHRSAEWKCQAISMLNKQIDRQFFDDGVGSEQAINYQCHTMDYYLVAHALGQQKNAPLAVKSLDRLHKATTFLVDLMHNNLEPPNIGDEDEGHVVPVLLDKAKVYSSIALACAVLPCQFEESFFSDTRSILFKNSEVNTIFYPPTKIRDTSWHVYPDGGYAVCHFWKEQKEKAIVVFDFGPIGQAPLRAHGHSDLLSVYLTYKNKPFLVDTGTYIYYGDDQWRNYFKGATAHNTLTIDGKNQIQHLGRFQWGREPERYWKLRNAHMIIASHSGYNVNYKVKHIRQLTVSDDLIEILDHVQYQNTKKPVDVTIHFHFHPKVNCHLLDQHTCILEHDGVSIRMQFPVQGVLNIHKGEIVPSIQGWYSDAFYQKVPSTTICIEFPACAGGLYMTSIQLLT